MNKSRRKELEKAIELLEQASDIIDSAKVDEEDAYDSLPAGIQDSERGETMQEAISSLEDALDNLESVTDAVQAAIDV